MAKRKVLIGISLARGTVTHKNSRGGEVSRPSERFDLTPGQVFDFTKDEIEEIEASQVGALSEIGEVDLDDGASKNHEVKSKAAAKGGKKTDESL